MHTDNVSFIFLLVFLKNVTSQPKVYVVDLINKGSEEDRQVKLKEVLKLIKDEGNLEYRPRIFHENLGKFDKSKDKIVKFAINDEIDNEGPKLDFDEQENFKVRDCWSLEPKDRRECLKYNNMYYNIIDDSKEIKEQRIVKIVKVRGESDVFKNAKGPDDCMALDATMFVQLRCLEKFKNKRTDKKVIIDSESEDSFENVKNPEDCWYLQNTPLSKKVICTKKLYDKNDEINYYDFKNIKDPNDCIFLKKSTKHKLKCLEILDKKKDKVPVDVIQYDNFDNITEPNECLFLNKATIENKLKCFDKFEKKIVEKVDDELENAQDPTDCLSLKTTIENKYKCLDKFGKTKHDYEFVSDDNFDNLQEPNDCLFIKATIERKLKCLDKFQMAEAPALRTEGKKVIAVPEDCLFAFTTYGKKLKCLDQLAKEKKNIRSRTIGQTSRFVATRPKRKIYSLYNYYNAYMKPSGFKDLTRQEFSQDYLDISELSRSIPKCRTPECNLDLLKLSYKLTEKKPETKNNSRRIFDSVHTRFIQSNSGESMVSDEIEAPRRKLQKKKNGIPVRFTVVSKEKPEDSDSDEHRSLKAENNGESVEDKLDSEEEHQILKKKKQSQIKKYKYTSEENGKNTFLLIESEEDVNQAPSVESETESAKKSLVKNKKKKKKSHDDDYSIETERPSSFKYSYLQGNNIIDYFRRRLEHFLPKRFHWEESDFKNLGFNWYDGPRGRWSK